MLEPGCSSSQSVREDTERDFKTADEAQESISSSSSTDEEEEEEEEEEEVRSVVKCRKTQKRRPGDFGLDRQQNSLLRTQAVGICSHRNLILSHFYRVLIDRIGGGTFWSWRLRQNIKESKHLRAALVGSGKLPVVQ